MTIVTRADNYVLNTDLTDASGTELRGNIIVVSSTHFRISYGGGNFDDIYGDFTYTNGKPTGGFYTSLTETLGGTIISSFSGLNISISSQLTWSDTNNVEALLNAVLGGGDTITASNLADIVRSRTGDDVLTGRGGNDILDGGAGSDTAVYSGRFQDYKVTNAAAGSLTITDLRAGSPEGVDTLTSIESLRFSDKTVSTVAPSPTAPLSVAFSNILRDTATGANAVTVNDLTAQVSGGTLVQAAAVNSMVVVAGATTSVATLAYQFFTGKTPSSGGYDFLVSPTGPNANNLNSAYYQSFNLENRYINFAVNLGKVGEGRTSFEATYGGKTLFDATLQAYTVLFGAAPSNAKVSLLLDTVIDGAGHVRADYFAGYGGDGLTGIGTKAAMVGWLMAEAIKADVGMFAKANDAFLADLSDGAAYSVDLIGVYGRPEYIYAG